jgi:hypothetical protein
LSTVSTGVQLIASERHRQIHEEQFTPEHDQAHNDGDLASAAACYAMRGRDREERTYSQGDRARGRCPKLWPWEGDAWKPTPNDRVRELVKAGALIAAEIDRLQGR